MAAPIKIAACAFPATISDTKHAEIVAEQARPALFLVNRRAFRVALPRPLAASPAG
jgi:hypothetical protein